jgi:hypothetical protein
MGFSSEGDSRWLWRWLIHLEVAGGFQISTVLGDAPTLYRAYLICTEALIIFVIHEYNRCIHQNRYFFIKFGDFMDESGVLWIFVYHAKTPVSYSTWHAKLTTCILTFSVFLPT